MATVHDVAAALLGELGAMSAMKLEKLVYYCQGWHLARHGQPMFAEDVEAWAQGPVVRSLYERHRKLYRVSVWPEGQPSKLTDGEQATVAWVARTYGRFSAERLSRMTHNEAPWRVARAGVADGLPSTNAISREMMATYFARLSADVETAVSHAAANAALEGMELDTDWQEQLRAVASGTVDPDRLVADLIARATDE